MRVSKRILIDTGFLASVVLLNLGFESMVKFSTMADVTQNPVPRFEPSVCAITVPETEKENVRCGYLVVPENRSHRNSRSIRLPVVILKSSGPNRAPDPILRTLGGPGGSSLKMVAGRQASPWLKDRDMIIFEQRGTRCAQPKLDCPEVDAAKIKNAKSNTDEQTAVRHEVEAAKACYERLVKEDIDLTGYDSAQSAADIEDLRHVLGYEKWNLYGVSYSARLMLEVMRDYPEGIRSVILESVLPPSVNYDETGIDGAVRALKVLFTNCAADIECAREYPRLEKVFYDLVWKANKKPIQLRVQQSQAAEPITIQLTGHDITTWLLDYVLSAGPDQILDGPLQIYQVVGGDYSPLKGYAESKLNPQGYMWGMRYSVWCREEMPFENRRTINAQARRYPQLLGYQIQASMPAICSVWRVPPAPAKMNMPVTSDIPTLILAGEYDAYTPPSWGRLTSQTLRNSYFYEVPGVGHGPGFVSGCAIRVAANFFLNPTADPYHRCLNAPRPKFVRNTKE